MTKIIVDRAKLLSALERCARNLGQYGWMRMSFRAGWMSGGQAQVIATQLRAGREELSGQIAWRLAKALDIKPGKGLTRTEIFEKRFKKEGGKE